MSQDREAVRDRPIVVEDLCYAYGGKVVHDRLSFSVEPGRIVGLLGKNGVGKTTLIKLLMGFLAPVSGTCRVLGEASHALSAPTKRRIGLVFEGHLAYEFLTIEETERFLAPWYPRWRKAVFRDFMDRLGLPPGHRIGDMSEGQRSQVVLAAVLAQDPDLLILDDYTMGLDAGYRRLFLDHLVHHARAGSKTVFVTSHVVQDMERLVDDVILLRRGGSPYLGPLNEFMGSFRRFRLMAPDADLRAGGLLHNVEREADGTWSIYAFHPADVVGTTLQNAGIDPARLSEVPLSLEDAFVGYTGSY
ncbi:ABC transporter ATP-binding protein [Xanthobacteraceae bacterium Astr-EGSB]|uniref:ABC transporter ATP-binding protein n=1 Tax=Astrobacterium formosum TaxID=3069710 RepID=UPI0027B25C8F|nr:ABC transporter ATP-binding protein [Xanthobacteraceae bacterium Astr-EGSB]